LPLKGKQLVIYPCKTLWRALGITHNHTSCIPQQVRGLNLSKNMCKKGLESFKEYAQRWRDLAAQVAPPMTKREMITVIVDTLPVFYYEKMVGYTPSSFADLVF